MTVRGQKWALVIAVLVFLVSTGINVYVRLTAQTETRDFGADVVKVLQKDCEQERARAEQYRIRGADLEVLAEAMIVQTEGAIFAIEKALPPGPAREGAIVSFESTLPRLNKIVEDVEILPLGSCKRQAEELAESLPPG